MRGLIPVGKRVYVWPQNDKPDVSGKIASEEWFTGIKQNIESRFYRVRIPERFKDLNAWTLGGATAADVLSLKDQIQQRVEEIWKVRLEPEPVMVGF